MGTPVGRRWPVVVKCYGQGYLAHDQRELQELIVYLEYGDRAAAAKFKSKLYSRDKKP